MTNKQTTLADAFNALTNASIDLVNSVKELKESLARKRSLLRYKATLMTTHDTVNGVRFSETVIKQILDEQPIVPVLDGSPQGNILGRTIHFYADDKEILNVAFESKSLDLDKRLYLVPCFIVKDKDILTNDNNDRIINAGSIYSAMLTLNPCDPALTPIEKDIGND